jgi:hypothetical protein
MRKQKTTKELKMTDEKKVIEKAQAIKKETMEDMEKFFAKVPENNKHIVEKLRNWFDNQDAAYWLENQCFDAQTLINIEGKKIHKMG